MRSGLAAVVTTTQGTKVEPLANSTDEIEVCISNIIDGLTVMMSNAHGEAYAHMNNGQFEALFGRPGGCYHLSI